VGALEIVGFMSAVGHPLAVSIVNDYEIIVRGLAAMLEPYSDRVRVVELEAGGEPTHTSDVALFDTFAGRRHSLERAEKMVVGQVVRHVVLYTWDATAEFLDDASRIGVSGVVLKSHGAGDLVDALERVAAGERVGLDLVSRGRESRSPPDLSMREREVLALVALGMSNREVAAELYLSVDTVKTYVRRLFSKLGVSNRTQAALRASGFDVQPPASRLI
jgi:DNA-binding NarL/FixJ family response regulator